MTKDDNEFNEYLKSTYCDGLIGSLTKKDKNKLEDTFSYRLWELNRAFRDLKNAILKDISKLLGVKND
jgi:hypothetical protein